MQIIPKNPTHCSFNKQKRCSSLILLLNHCSIGSLLCVSRLAPGDYPNDLTALQHLTRARQVEIQPPASSSTIPPTLMLRESLQRPRSAKSRRVMHMLLCSGQGKRIRFLRAPVRYIKKGNCAQHGVSRTPPLGRSELLDNVGTGVLRL